MSKHIPFHPKTRQVKCIVCKLETNTALGGKAIGERGICTNVATCPECKMSAHTVVPKNKRKLHSILQWQNKTCWEIMHSPDGFDLWQRIGGEKIAYAPHLSHPIYREVRVMYGKPGVVSRPNKKRHAMPHMPVLGAQPLPVDSGLVFNDDTAMDADDEMETAEL